MNETERQAEIDRLADNLLKNKQGARELVEFLINVTAACHVNGCGDDESVPDFVRHQAEHIGVLRRQLEKLGAAPAACICHHVDDGVEVCTPECLYCRLWDELAAEAVRESEDDQDAKAFGEPKH
jgi:hypothetical protein